MKKLRILYSMLICILGFSINLISQDLNILDYIGKTQKEIIAKLGNPFRIDSSITSKIYLFYKSPAMVFLSDEKGIYQAEISKVYSSESYAKMEIDELIKHALIMNFEADSVSNSNIVLVGNGIRANIQLTNQEEKGQYCLKIIAVKQD